MRGPAPSQPIIPVRLPKALLADGNRAITKGWLPCSTITLHKKYQCDSGLRLIYLNQISARVGEDRDSDGAGDRRLPREDHALLLEPLHLTVNIHAFESGCRNAGLHECGLIGVCDWVSVRLKHQLEIVWTFG